MITTLTYHSRLTVVLFLIITTFYIQNLQAQTPVAVHGKLSIVDNKLKDKNGNDYQLRGMSFFWSNWQGKMWNYETVKWLRDDWHCNVVRAAMGVSPDDNSGYLGNPEIEMHKMITVIEAAIDLGIYVVVDWHSHHAENETSDAQKFFAEIARKYGSYPNIIYETYNEPITDWNTIKNYHEDVLDSIRAYDPDNIVILGTPFYSQEIDAATNNPVKYNNAELNLCYALHFYASTHTFWDVMQTVSNKDYYVFVSEFGTCDASGNGSINVQNSNTWWDKMDALGISWCNWAVSDVDEAASCVKPGSSPTGGWNPATDLTTSGTMVRNRLRSYPQDPVPTNIAPYITASPQSQSVEISTKTNFSVEVVGPGSISYQWYFNGNEISGATGATYSINSTTEANIGDYYCVITNSYGSTTSKTVTTDVRYRSTFYTDPLSIPGVIQFEDYDNGGQNIGYYDASFGNTPAGYRTDDVDIEAINNNGDFCVGFTDAGEWLSYTVNVGWDADYTVDIYYASQLGGGQYSIELDGQTIAPAKDVGATGGWTTYSKTSTTVALTKGEHILKFNILKAGFNIDYMEFKSKIPPQIAPYITMQPKNTSARLSKGASMYVSATGAEPMTYQWYYNGSAITGATDAMYSISSVKESDAGDYYVVITNSLGSATSNTVSLEVVNTNAYLGIQAEIPGRVLAKNFDEGGQNVGYFDTTDDNEGVSNSGASNFYRDESVDTETCSDGGSGHSVGYIVADEWMEYSVIVKYTGKYKVGFRVASESNVGAISLTVDGMPGISSLGVPNTGGWTKWQTIETTLDLTAGGHILRFKANQGGFNLNYIDFGIDLLEQNISLSTGWNLFTLTLIPSDASVETIFKGISGLIVKSDEKFFIESQPSYLNSLTELKSAKGYLVYNPGATATIKLQGTEKALNPDFNTLPSGWNLIGIGENDINTSSLPSSVSTVKDFDGYYQNGSASSLNSLLKGKAYFVKKN